MAFDGLDPVKNTYTFENQGAGSVDNAPTGKHRLINRDGSLFLVDDSGVESAIGSGGESGINYVLNSDAEVSETQDVTATNVTLAAETVAPLVGSQSFELTSQASTGTFDFDLKAIDNFVLDGAIALELKAYLDDQAGAGSDGDWKIGVYNVTDAVYEVEQDLVTGDLNIAQGLLFVPVSGKTYVVRVERTISVASDVLVIDRVILTPDGNGAIPIAASGSPGLVDPTSGITSQDVVSGTTPPVTFVSADASWGTVTVTSTMWSRIGNIVDVAFTFSTSTAANLTTNGTFGVPFANNNFSSPLQANGHFRSQIGGVDTGGILDAVTASQNIQLQILDNTAPGSPATYRVFFKYEIV